MKVIRKQRRMMDVCTNNGSMDWLILSLGSLFSFLIVIHSQLKINSGAVLLKTKM